MRLKYIYSVFSFSLLFVGVTASSEVAGDAPNGKVEGRDLSKNDSGDYKELMNLMIVMGDFERNDDSLPAPLLISKADREIAVVAIGKMFDEIYQRKLLKNSNNSAQKSVTSQSSLVYYYDKKSERLYYVESDGRHLVVFSKNNELLWRRDPFVDSNMKPYRTIRPVIQWIGRSNLGDHISIGFDSSQFGTIDEKTGDFTFGGQN